MGFCVVMGISLEIVCLNYSKGIMELFGPRNMMIAGQLALIIRVGLYGFLGKNMKPWMALLIEMVTITLIRFIHSSLSHYVYTKQFNVKSYKELHMH